MTRMSEHAQQKLNQLVDDNDYFVQKKYDAEQMLKQRHISDVYKRHLSREVDLYKLEINKIKKEIKDVKDKYKERNTISKVNSGYYTVIPKAMNRTISFINISNTHDRSNASQKIKINNNPPPYWWLGGNKPRN